jgi:hypothetical protein
MEINMFQKLFQKRYRFIVTIALLAIFSISCGLINRAIDQVMDTGLQSLIESGVLEEVFSVMDRADSESMDFSPLEVPGAVYLFELDPFDDVIRWRFYTVNASEEDVSDFYSQLLPDFSVEVDRQVNGFRHLVLTADHLLSSVYSKEQLQALGPGYQMMKSTLLDVEVLHSTAHQGTGRWGIADMLGVLPGAVPEESTLLIMVYNQSGINMEGIVDLVPGMIPGFDENDRDADDLQNGDDRDTGEGDLPEFTEDDDIREITDTADFCGQVLGSGSCYHPYIPVAEGYTRSYRTADGVTTETVSEVRADGFTVTTTLADGSSVATEFECTPDGVAGWDFDDTIMDSLEGVPANLDFDIEIEGLQLPREILPGDTWTAVVNVRISAQAAGVDSSNVITIELDYTAVGEETVTTPSGRFSAMRVDYVSSGENIQVVQGPAGTLTQPIFTLNGSGSDWYVECVGKVRSESHATWAGIATVESTTRMELVDFGIQ